MSDDEAARVEGGGHDAGGKELALRWPPPGLERLQGDLKRVATRAALCGGILVAPLLFVLGRDLGFATLGPFADAWWVTLVLAIVGLAFAADALVRTMTLLRRVSEALKTGYDLRTVQLVIADSDRDMGFLLTGGRHFSVMDEKEREAIGALRVFSLTLYAVAGIWLPNALAVGIFLGARGIVSPDSLWMLTALPALALYAFGLVAGTVAESRVRRARLAWHGQPWVEDLASDEAAAWRDSLPTKSEGEPVRGGVGSGLGLRGAAILVGVLAVVVAIPILTLLPTAAIGPILTDIAVPDVAIPGHSDLRVRSARVEAMRLYRLPPDPTVTPQQAGRLFHDLAFVGSDGEPNPGEREPSRRIAEPWFPDIDEANPTGVHPVFWSDSLFSVLAGGATEDVRTYLQEVADHPARADLSRLARAGAIDVASARYVDPLPDEITLPTLPIPRFTWFWNGVYSHIGAAASEMLGGQTERAEELLAEVISVGFLLGDGGPTLIDNLIGYTVIERGTMALAGLYAATGQDQRGERLRELRSTAERASAHTRFRYPQGVEAWVRSLPAMVADTGVVRGLRWELFVDVTTLTPCLNLQRLVFGPDEEYWDFVNEAYDHLVEWPSEDGLYERARAGWFGTRGESSGSIFGRLLSVAMRTGEGTCGEVVRQLELSEVF